jgi:hypothetical protein
MALADTTEGARRNPTFPQRHRRRSLPQVAVIGFLDESDSVRDVG